LFTGIIEETGTIRSLRCSSQGGTLLVCAQKILSDLKPGDSVAVNGVCLTVVDAGGGCFASDLSAETLRRSSLAEARAGKVVNLERAMAAGGRFGGHIVQGHVDAVGKLLSSAACGEGFEMEFSIPAEMERYLVMKGSVAVDGISLTVAALARNSFKVAVIPHTHRITNLQHLNKGDTVNLETDILAKYIERFFQLSRASAPDSKTKLSVEALREQGY
jgi:riboflavin synthase